MSGVLRTVCGVVLILVSAPLFLVVVPGFKGMGVIGLGAAFIGLIVLGIVLAGRWLGVFERRKVDDVRQPGCLALLVTLLALLEGAVILYYVVYYGAGAYLGGWNV